MNNLQVGTTNTDVDNGLHALASVSLPVTAAHLLGELLHVLQDGVHALDDALTINLHGLVADIAQSCVVDSAVLCEVDVLTLEHGIAKLFQVSLLGKLHQEIKSLVGDEVLGEVEKNVLAIHGVGKGTAEFLETAGVFLELFLQHNALANSGMVLLERFPRVQIGGLLETGHLDDNL